MLILGIFVMLTVLIFFSAFFSGSETAHIALSKIKLRNLIKQGVKNARVVQRIILNLDTFIPTILIGNNLVNTAISAIVTTIFVSKLGPSWGIAVSTFVTTFFLLILCEIIPKTLSIRYPGKIALFTAPLMQRLISLFRPWALFFSGISRRLIKLFGGTTQKRVPLITEEELRMMIEVGKEEGVVSDQERKMLHRIFEFGDTRVEEVMVPREEIVAVDLNRPPETLLGLISEEGHSRFPVYRGSLDNIVGVIYIRDLLYILRHKELVVIDDLVHNAYFVSPQKRVNDLLVDFQRMKIQIAVVSDGNKKTLGLVTLEDLLEEIVGEIEEEA
ncbi:MAG: hemolysin family protein [Candidatus Omnitrophota bacterium]